MSNEDDDNVSGDDCEDNAEMEITKLPNMSTLELTRRIPSILIKFGKNQRVTEKADWLHRWR